MAIDQMLDLLIRANFPSGKPIRGDCATNVVPLFKYACERARRLGCDIDRPGRAARVQP